MTAPEQYEPAGQARPGAEPPQGAAAGADGPDGNTAPATDGPVPSSAENEESSEHAWDSRRGLLRHSPGIVFGHSGRIGGSLVGGDQHGVSGGKVTGDVILGGSKVEYHLGGDSEERSGEIPATEVEVLAGCFVYPEATPEEALAARTAPGASTAQGVAGEVGSAGGAGGAGEAGESWAAHSPFGRALGRLRRHRVVVLAGPARTGRRSAARMLLRTVGATAYRGLDPALAAGRLPAEIRERTGHVLYDFATSAERPLREHHLGALSERLEAVDSYLVIVVGPHPVVHGGHGPVHWQPPEAARLVGALLEREGIGAAEAAELLAIPETEAVIGHRRPVAELVGFAERLLAYAQERITRAELAAFGPYAAARQVREWFDRGELGLHDQAFLIALAAFDESPYAITAELSDVLFGLLQEIENPGEPARIPVFGSSSAQRVELAQAHRYEETEESEWGAVPQTKLQFRNPETALTLLGEVWTGHPSARPALVKWLRRLAVDPRALVRTRAAYAAAALAATDLPSTMSLLIRPWAADRRFHARLAAANALALAHLMKAPHVPEILRGWSSDRSEQLRATAVRAYAMVGEAFPGSAITALLEAPKEKSKELTEQAAAASVILLASGQESGGGGTGIGVAAQLWAALVPLAQQSASRLFVLGSFINACGPTEGEAGGGRPLLLDQYGRGEGDPGTPGELLRRSLASLWRITLNDRELTNSGRWALAGWVRSAESDPEAERSLAELLPALAVSAEDTKRLSYLLENLRADGPGEQPPLPVATRLQAALG
ncbi:hypothetical protein ABT095_32565 [Kitasatospora sp. NPDC002227]|uniref:hypothetical protein n=1 Tax=Kitasatospora sp. NPDC002227 TaxID=3154773 RepID=UPI003317AFEA